MEQFREINASGGRLNMALGAVHQVAAIALIAVIVFGDVASASDGVKRLVAFASVLGAITSWIFVSNALKAFQDGYKDLSPQEAASAYGKTAAKQPWMVYQLYTLVVTVATIFVTITAIY